MKEKTIAVIGSGNAAFCAAIAALEQGAKVRIFEKADRKEWGGNSRYTAGAMRFAYEGFEDLRPLLRHTDDERIPNTDFSSYPKEKFLADLQHFNVGIPPNEMQQYLVQQSLPTMQWLASHNIWFDPIYSRQTFQKDGKYIFWGGLTLESEGEGDGLVHAERAEFLRLGGKIRYGCEVVELSYDENKHKVNGIKFVQKNILRAFKADAVILASGGFEANKELRVKYLGEKWANARVRGTRHNQGQGITMAQKIGAATAGYFAGCHATPMDYNMPEYGNLDIPHIERKHYRKISYLFGIMLNEKGERFVDEGMDFRNYTYAQFGKAVLEQPNNRAWQIFDAKVWNLLYGEYKTSDATFMEANTIEELIAKIEGIDHSKALQTIKSYNAAVDIAVPFDPTIKDGRSAKGVSPSKSNWANTLDTPPFRAYPVTGGITFTYGGLHVNTNGCVLNEKSEPIAGLFACGELVGGVFFHGYPGGSGLTSGAVFGRAAGYAATRTNAKTGK